LLVVGGLAVVGFLEDVYHADEVISQREEDKGVGAGDRDDEADVYDEEDRAVSGFIKNRLEEVGLNVLACK